MPEPGLSHLDRVSTEVNSTQRFNIIVIGPAGSGKTTFLQELGQHIPVFTEPDNPAFEVMLKGLETGKGEHLHYTSQLSKMSQLMTAEAASMLHEASIVAIESSVLATAMYNRQFHDHGLITDDQFAVLEAVHQEYLARLKHSSTLVVFLNAQKGKLEDRTLKRDGVVANDYNAQSSYWVQLLDEIRAMGIPVHEMDTTADPLPSHMRREVMGKVDYLAA